MIKVEVRFKGGESGDFVCEQIDLFNMVWSLSLSEFVREFRVEGTVPANFGWGDIGKWVVEFNWENKT